MGQIMGKGVTFQHSQRCHFCQRPVKYGYYVNQGPTQGFFCGRICLERATARMSALKKEKGIQEEA
jgi:hypothetical protein